MPVFLQMQSSLFAAHPKFSVFPDTLAPEYDYCMKSVLKMRKSVVILMKDCTNFALLFAWICPEIPKDRGSKAQHAGLAGFGLDLYFRRPNLPELLLI